MRWIVPLLIAACAPVESLVDPNETTDDPVVDTDTTPAAAPLTWHGTTRAIFETRCVSCHNPDGTAPFSLEHDDADWANGTPRWAGPSALAVAGGSMPPWKADTDCKPIVGERVLTDTEKQLIADWATAGFPEGDPADYVAPPPAEGLPTTEPDLVLHMPEAFVADKSAPDDYQCFVLDYDSTEDRWLKGFDVLPDQRSIVHHVILYQLDEEYADDVAAWDAAVEGPGYDCLFDPGTFDSRMIGGWAPGQVPVQYPEGVGRHIPAGSKLVLQVHYNVAQVPTDEAPPADQSGAAFWWADNDAVTQELVSIPFPVYPTIPAGDPEVVAEENITLEDFLYYVPSVLLDLFADQVKVIGYYPHMHQLGTQIRFDLIREGVETCEMAVNDWDFAWQQAYYLPEEAWYSPETTDTLRVRCVYDNSAENQPVINGVQQEPRDVYWGEGSYDEMCLVFLETLVPPGLLNDVF